MMGTLILTLYAVFVLGVLFYIGGVIVAFIVWEIIKLVLAAIGLAIPAIIITLIGLLILIGVIIYILRIFGISF